MNDSEYTRKRDSILSLFTLKGFDEDTIQAFKEAMDMAYEMGFESGYSCGANNATTGD